MQNKEKHTCSDLCEKQGKNGVRGRRTPSAHTHFRIFYSKRDIVEIITKNCTQFIMYKVGAKQVLRYAKADRH